MFEAGKINKMTTNSSFTETLLPALLQCFGIMFFGYILGKSKILGQKEAAGISIFVLYLSLPAVIFLRLATISLENVNWSFIASIFVSKAVIFCLVALLTMLLTQPINLGKAGIFSITTTLSNDFALGYPLFLSLYKDSHPDYPGYLYIIAPAQLLIFNTIGFFIMEIHLQKNGHSNTKCHFLKVIKSTLTNPIVFMTIIGLIWNFSFSYMPAILKTILQALSDAFPATALLLVGHTMAIKSEKYDNHIPITVALLIIAKNLISPIIMQKFGSMMMQGNNESEMESLSSFGFLYGTTPAAPSSYVFATQYDIAIDEVTKTIIGSTLVSAPLMFASASVISLSGVAPEDVSNYLSLTMSYLSCVSFLCCSWILISYVIGKRFQHIKLGVTFCIIFSQLMTSIGGILLFFKIRPFSFIFYIQYILSIGGILAARICTLFLAVLIVVIRWKSICFTLQIRKHINIISIICVICPFVVTACLIAGKTPHPDGPNNQLGHVQVITVFTITVICCLGTILCLILQHICFRKKTSNSCENMEESVYISETSDMPTLANVSVTENEEATLTSAEEEISIDVENSDGQFTLSVNSESCHPRDIEESLCDSRQHCTRDQRLQCAIRVSEYRKEDKYGLYDNTEIFQHTFLIIGICVAMTMSLAVSFWKLIMEVVNGIFYELQFLDVIMNYNLGILFFIVLGFDQKTFYTLSNKWKIIWYGYKKNLVKASSREICQDFLRKHKDKFMTANEKNRETIYKEHQNLFSSSDLMKWLIENENLSDAKNAELYISYLLQGQIIEKVDQYELFADNVPVYRFKK